MSTATQPMYKWNTLPWGKIEREVFKLQKRIYQASSRGDDKAVHRLQRLLSHSWSAKCLAVRRVTQDNQGKRTPGIDGIKSLTPNQRCQLVEQLQLNATPQPVRRIWIPKPGSTEKRPLGIATMRDRALQTLVKLALEPEWEAQFEANSYGFRPGRSCHDAVAAIAISINQRPSYVLDADIAQCFDKINQQQLVAKLGTYPKIRRLIKGWLQAGVMDDDHLYPTAEGVPQGGPLSPLLANVALHGLETTIREAFPESIKQAGKRVKWRPTVIRYADDFVVLHRDENVIRQIQQITEEWLAEMGLALKPSKTHITHTLIRQDGKVGFDFLGFHIQQYSTGKTHTGHDSQGRPLGYKTNIRPSAKAIQRHNQALQEVVQRYRNAPQTMLITKLNPLIRGWTNYYATVASAPAFSKMSHLTYQKLRSWARHRHPNWTMKRITQTYWRLETGQWIFGPREGPRLYRHWQTHLIRYHKVKGRKSPYDGDWVYWASRLGRDPQLPRRVAVLLAKQQGQCPWCGLYFKDEDRLEVDHILPRSLGGKDTYANWQLLHRHCHDAKTVQTNRSV